MTILRWMESISGEKVLENLYFFCENGDEFSWKRCAEGIGKELLKAGRIQDPTPREIPSDFYNGVFGEWSVMVIC